MSSGPALGLPKTVAAWWRSESSRRGKPRALRALAERLGRFLIDSTPARRRSRYGDVEYDWDYRVDTTSATVHWRDRLLGLFHSPYQPTAPELFAEIMGHLRIDFPQFTFIDIGSGKGRVLLMASQFGFAEIIGVEILPGLHRVAEENLRRFAARAPQAGAIRALCQDALDFVFPARPLVVYLFNPLPEGELLRLLDRLCRSLERQLRPAYLVYHNPEWEQALAKSERFRPLLATSSYCIYSWLPSAAGDAARPEKPGSQFSPAGRR